MARSYGSSDGDVSDCTGAAMHRPVMSANDTSVREGRVGSLQPTLCEPYFSSSRNGKGGLGGGLVGRGGQASPWIPPAGVQKIPLPQVAGCIQRTLAHTEAECCLR